MTPSPSRHPPPLPKTPGTKNVTSMAADRPQNQYTGTNFDKNVKVCIIPNIQPPEKNK